MYVMTLMDRTATSRALNEEMGRLEDTCLQAQFDDVCSSKDFQLGDHGFGYFERCIRDPPMECSAWIKE